MFFFCSHFHSVMFITLCKILVRNWLKKFYFSHNCATDDCCSFSLCSLARYFITSHNLKPYDFCVLFSLLWCCCCYCHFVCHTFFSWFFFLFFSLSTLRCSEQTASARFHPEQIQYYVNNKAERTTNEQMNTE